MKRALLVAALVLAAALSLSTRRASAGPPDQPIGDGRFGRVRLGWEGHVPRSGVFPAVVFLENPDTASHVFRVVLATGPAQAEETVTLAPGARRRLSFVLPVERPRLSVSLSEDGKLVSSSALAGESFPTPVVLLVDGDPGSRQVAEVVSGVAVLECAPEDLTPELACLTPFQAIVVRHCNPTRAGESARGVLEDYVRVGGTIVVCPDDASRETRALWEETASSTTRTTSGLPVKRRGLGRVLLAPGDPSAATPGGAALRSAIAGELDPTPRRLFPRFFASEGENEAAHHASVLLDVFFLLYFVVAGPLLARRLRGASPGRVLRAVLLVVLVFSGLAGLMAVQVRHQSSRVTAYTFVVIPEAGDPVASTEVIVASGGAARETLALEGEDVSATAAQRATSSYTFDNRVSDMPQWTPSSVRTKRGIGRHPVTFESLEVPTLGDTRVSAIADAPGYRPLDARLEVDPRTLGLVVTVHNTSGRALGPIVVYDTTRGDFFHARFPHGLEPGASAVAPLTTRSFAGTPLRLAGFPAPVVPYGWDTLAPRGPDGSNPSFVLIAEDEVPVRVKAAGALVRQRAWRIESVAPPPAGAPLPGFVGLVVAPMGLGVKIVTSSTTTPGQRLLVGWQPPAGFTILSIGGMPVHSQEDLDRAFARVPDDGTVEIVTTNFKTTVTLSTPVAVPGAGGEGGE